MGHMVGYRTYPENVDKRIVYADINEILLEENYVENSNGLTNPIRWYEDIQPLLSYEDAKRFIEEHDKKWYDNLAVRFKDIDSLKETKKLKGMKDRYKQIEQDYAKMLNTVECKSFKSQLISCKQCNSKLNKDYMRTNKCPLCGFDIRSDTTKQRILNKEKSLRELKKQIDMEIKKLQEQHNKKSSRSRVYWLVKYEGRA